MNRNNNADADSANGTSSIATHSTAAAAFDHHMSNPLHYHAPYPTTPTRIRNAVNTAASNGNGKKNGGTHHVGLSSPRDALYGFFSSRPQGVMSPRTPRTPKSLFAQPSHSKMISKKHLAATVFILLGLILLSISVVVLGKKIHRWRTCRPHPTDDEHGYSQPVYPKPQHYLNSHTLKRQADACAESLDFPQVALLFLVKGDIHHEALWAEWFAYAAGKVPLASLCEKHLVMLHGAGTHSVLDDAVVAHCGRHSGGKSFLRDDASYSNSGENDDGNGKKEGNTIDGASDAARRIATSAADAAGHLHARSRSNNDIELDLRDILDRQHLFDVWVHPSLDFSGFPPSSIFHGKELPQEYRVNAVWGTHTLVDATRALIAAALTNQRATKFVLVSESDVPLYNPLVLYQQLIHEPRSRLNACNVSSDWDTDAWQRFREDMRTAGLTQELWRKSWQWVALTRQHAELMVHDVAVDEAFRMTCRQRWDYEWCSHKVCYSDEHYLATLIAVHGRDNETDCTGELTDRDWSRVMPGDPHPYEYHPSEVTQGLLSALRHAERAGCHRAEEANAAALERFVDVEKARAVEDSVHAGGDDGSSDNVHSVGNKNVKGLGHTCAALLHETTSMGYDDGSGGRGGDLIGRKDFPLGRNRLLGAACPLLARKFLNSTVDAVLASILPCSSSSLSSYALSAASTAVSSGTSPSLSLHAPASLSLSLGIVNNPNCSDEEDDVGGNGSMNSSVMDADTRKRQNLLLERAHWQLISTSKQSQYPVHEKPSAAKVYIVWLVCIAALGGILYGVKRRRRAWRKKQLPLAHRDSFHSLLKAYGAIE